MKNLCKHRPWWRPVRLLPLALLAVLALLPPAHGQEAEEALCIIFVRPLDASFQILEVAADLILSPEQRVNISERVDADADGVITAEEVSVWQNETSVSTDGWNVPFERRIMLDGSDAFLVDTYTRLRDWTGPVEDARKGVVTEARYYRYAPDPSSMHEIRGGLYIQPAPTPQVVIEVVVIEAPNGWVVSRLSQVDANGTETNVSYPEERSVRLSGFDLSQGAVTFRDATVVATPPPTTSPDVTPTAPPSEAIPAPGWIAALVLLALTALARRGRR